MGWEEGVIATVVFFHMGEAHDDVPAEDLVVAVISVVQGMVEEVLGVVPACPFMFT